MSNSWKGITTLPETTERLAGLQLTAAASASPIQYWTEQNMREAAPMPIPFIPTPIPIEQLGLAITGWDGGAGPLSAPVPPDNFDAVTATASGFITTPVGSQYAQYPYSTIGKLFMVFPGGRGYGTGWVIAERAIVTAGHCIKDYRTGQIATSVMFAGGYLNGQYTQQWNIIKRGVTNAWLNHFDFRGDIAVCITDRPIRPTLGKLGLPPEPDQFNYPTLARYTQVGYPTKGQFEHEQQMWQSIGDFIDTPMPISARTGTVRAGNNMTEGCSGGPWLGTGANINRAFGLNSHRLPNEVNSMTSPYFGIRLEELVQWILDNGGNEG